MFEHTEFNKMYSVCFYMHVFNFFYKTVFCINLFSFRTCANVLIMCYKIFVDLKLCERFCL